MSSIQPFDSWFLVSCRVLGLAGLCGLTRTCWPVGSVAGLGFAFFLGGGVSVPSALHPFTGVLALLSIFLPA